MSEIDEIKKIVKSLAISQVKTDEQLKELKVFQAKTDKQIQILSKKVDATITELKGLTKNQGTLLEQIFYYSFVKNKNGKYLIGSIEYDRAYINQEAKGHGLKQEFDFIFENGQYVAIVEVKSRAKKGVISQLQTAIQNYKVLYPHNKEKTIKGYIASFQFDKNVISLASEKGFQAITLKGEFIDLEN